MKRRRFVRSSSLAALGIAGIAGCAAPGEETPIEGTPAGEGTTIEAETVTPTETETETPAETETSAAESGENEIAMQTEDDEYYFDPIGLYVKSGETVTFRIESGSHSSTAYQQGNGPAEVTRIPEGAEAWDSGTLSEQGATFDHTFETAGTYDYFCIPHKQLGMVGRIVVDEPGGPAEGSMPPDGDVPDSQTIVDEGAISHSDFSS